MIPFRDSNPSGTVPVVTIGLVVINLVVFFFEISQPRGHFVPLLEEYGLRPVLVSEFLRGNPRLAGYFVPIFRPFITSMFLHASLLHVLGNMLYLWIFGDNVEDRLGHAKFAAFYLLCGLGAGAAHVASSPDSMVPTVGASGAIAGVLGAYLVAFPRARVSSLVFIGFFFTVISLPAFVVLGFWFLLQYVGGMAALRMHEAGGVAWWAHVGGFVLGILLLPLLQKAPPKRRSYVVAR